MTIDNELLQIKKAASIETAPIVDLIVRTMGSFRLDRSGYTEYMHGYQDNIPNRRHHHLDHLNTGLPAE